MPDESSSSLRALIRKEVGTNVRVLRAVRRVQQGDIAAGMRDLGFTEWQRQTVGAVESGKRGLHVEELYALAAVLEASTSRLMTLSSPKKRGSPAEQNLWRIQSGASIRNARVFSELRRSAVKVGGNDVTAGACAGTPAST